MSYPVTTTKRGNTCNGDGPASRRERKRERGREGEREREKEKTRLQERPPRETEKGDEVIVTVAPPFSSQARGKAP